MNEITEVNIPQIEDFIKGLERKDLMYLNRIIVDRLKLLSQQKTTENMARFHVTQRVRFTSSEGAVKTGRVIRINKKSVSVITYDDEKWNVSPVLLECVD